MGFSQTLVRAAGVKRLERWASWLTRAVQNRRAWFSYSQCGEDLVMSFLAREYLRLDRITYLDIGAHHPWHLNNTYLFYQQGYSGVCVEPNPQLFRELKCVRRRDTCLNVGVGGRGRTAADFFVLSSSTLSTFSRAEAERYVATGNQQIRDVLKIEMVDAGSLIAQYFPNGPHIVSVDVEGLELTVLRSMDFSFCRPDIFCIETLTYAEDGCARKVTETVDYMHQQGYMTYADTYINTIFVEREKWGARPC